MAAAAVLLLATMSGGDRAARITAAFDGVKLSCVRKETQLFTSKTVVGYQRTETQTFVFRGDGTCTYTTSSSMRYNDKAKENKKHQDTDRENTRECRYQVSVSLGGEVFVTIDGDRYAVTLDDRGVPKELLRKDKTASGTLVQRFDAKGGSKYIE